MKNVLLAATCCSLLITVAGSSVYAEEQQPVSTIRQAAIDILEKKLGTIRGSIKPKSRNIYVTEKMVNRFKPITKEELAQAIADEQREAEDSNNYAELDEALRQRKENAVSHEAESEVAGVPSPNYDERRIERRLSTLASANAARSERLQREIFRAIRANMSKAEADNSLITNSIGEGSLPNTSDMDTLLAAVEEMVDSQD